VEISRPARRPRHATPRQPAQQHGSDHQQRRPGGSGL